MQCCSRHPPAEKINEERSPHEGGHCAHGKLGWGYDGACQCICNDDRDGPAEGGSGDEDAMIRTEEQTHDVGNEEANISDGSANGNGEAGKNRCGDVDDEAHTANIDTEMHGFFFAGEEQV